MNCKAGGACAGMSLSLGQSTEDSNQDVSQCKCISGWKQVQVHTVSRLLCHVSDRRLVMEAWSSTLLCSTAAVVRLPGGVQAASSPLKIEEEEKKHHSMISQLSKKEERPNVFILPRPTGLRWGARWESHQESSSMTCALLRNVTVACRWLAGKKKNKIKEELHLY